MDHNHPDFHLGHHICMWEGPTYTPSALEVNYDALKVQHQSNIDELQRLRALLDANKITWARPKPVQYGMLTRAASLRKSTLVPWTRSAAANFKASQAEKSLPHLPNEIILRILSITVTQPRPVIDPFWKLRPENMTQNEKSQSSISLAFLSTCKALRAEGIKLFITNNTFVFTQVEALQNFANYSPEARGCISHVTLRVVGKYFDDTAYKKTLRGDFAYHSAVSAPTVWVQARPSSSPKDKGIQSYSWQQLIDFLKALVVRKGPVYRHQQLLANLKTMRIDLVNFCEHIPFLGSPFISIIRWHVGKLLDELIVTGTPDEEWSSGEERFISGLVKDEGLFGTGCPVFVSTKVDRLKPLPGYGLNLQIMRTTPKPTDSIKKVKTKIQKPTSIRHPEGGFPPTSRFSGGLTIWKWTTDSLSESQKKWIEFHRRCGLPVDDCGELQAMLVDEALGSVSMMDEDSWEDAGDNAEMLSDVE